MFKFIKKIFRRNKMGEIQLNEVETIIQNYFASKKFKDKLNGIKYFRGDHKVLNRLRTAIGEDGKLVEVPNLPNNRLVDNQYKKLVKQKVNYILAKPFSLKSKNQEYAELLNEIFDKEFMRVLKRVGTDVYNTGLGWIYVFYNDGKLEFKRLNSIECIPVWKNNEHDELDYLIRVYDVKEFENGRFNTKSYVEIYTLSGIQRYELRSRNTVSYVDTLNYMEIDGEKYNWERIPIVCFRADELEQPLLNRVKALQDCLNELISDFANNMQENNRNAILILKEYDGENLGKFRHNLNTYGAVKVKNDGGLEKLEMNVDATNYESVVKILKKAIIENGGGFDSKSDTLGNNPNQLNIRSMYSDVDLEANDLETEFQASFEELLWFVNQHMKNTAGKSRDDKAEFVLNRDILINESQAITDLKNSIGLISQKTIVANHPYVTDADEEMKQLKAEKQENIEDFGAFGEHKHSHGNVDE